MSGGGKQSDWTSIDTPEAAAVAVAKLDRLGGSAAGVAARRRCLDLLDPRPGERILDVGGGTGLAAIEIARRVAPGGRAVLLDPSSRLLEVAAERAAAAGLGGNLECRAGDGRAAPFADGAFDRAFCQWVLLHVGPPEAIVDEMRRVVRRGGRIVCVELDWEAPILHPGDPMVTRRIFDFCNARHVEQYMGRRLPAIFSACRLTDIRVEPVVLLDRGAAGRQWLDYLATRVELALAGGAVTAAEAARWTADIEAAASEGRYLFAVTQLAVAAAVPA
jgi:ubiquinone/menaquinone biosynthesis C-methylase UbiE